jgi:hypothetical protein
VYFKLDSCTLAEVMGELGRGEVLIVWEDSSFERFDQVPRISIYGDQVGGKAFFRFAEAKHPEWQQTDARGTGLFERRQRRGGKVRNGGERKNQPERASGEGQSSSRS